MQVTLVKNKQSCTNVERSHIIDTGPIYLLPKPPLVDCQNEPNDLWVGLSSLAT